MALSQTQISQLNDLKALIEFKKTWMYQKLITSPAKITALFFGNQGGKTGSVSRHYVDRILGIHPISTKNVVYWECENHRRFMDEEISYREFYDQGHRKRLFGGGYLFDGSFNAINIPEKCPFCGGKILRHDRKNRTFRFCSETLPGQSSTVKVDGATAEVKNTQYPEFKKWLPPFLIKKDITFRSPAMVIQNIHGPGDIIVEFVSYNQSVQSTAGTQRLSIWYDEQPDLDFREEQQPRLLAEDGDEVITCTPADYITWMYDVIFENAAVYYRTQAICDFLNKDLREGDIAYEQYEKTGRKTSICVIQAATDDNPTLKKAVIEQLFESVDDPDVYAIRRYGIFKQVSGRIFKDFTQRIHVIENSFPEGKVPFPWTHARGIDYHPQTPWAFGCISLSPTDEAFIWLELNPSPEKYTTEEISEQIARHTGDYRFRLDLVDPLSEGIKQNGVTVLQDLNDAFLKLKRLDMCSGGYWRTWNTRGEHGRDEIKKRLKNSIKVGKPFNNAVIERGRKVYLPTLWILDNCKLAAKSMRQWRWEEYADSKSKKVKGEKNKPEQAWSHMNMVWEAIFKDPSFIPNRNIRREERTYGYFQRRG